MALQLSHLHKEFDRLQLRHGAAELCGIYGAGCINRPRACFVFMNPTARNIACAPSWNGIRAPWLGIKNIWKLMAATGCISDKTLAEILAKRPVNWDNDFAESLYRELADNRVYITNLGKCTQSDAAHLPDKVFHDYLPLLEREITEINPRLVITFGNRVSSLFLGMPIKVSETRKKIMMKNGRRVMCVYYPVGNGFRNVGKSIEDINFGLSHAGHD